MVGLIQLSVKPFDTGDIKRDHILRIWMDDESSMWASQWGGLI